MATLQQAIDQARKAGVSEDIIAKKVQEYGGTYTPQTPSVNLSGVTGPEELVAKSNLPKPSFLERIGNFLAPTMTANIKDIGASFKSVGAINKQDELTKKKLELAEQIRQANKRGDKALAKKLSDQSRALLSEVEMPEFSKYTQDQIKSGQTGKIRDYLVRGAKTGAEIGSYLTPLGKGLNAGAKMGLGALSGGLRGFGSSEVGSELGGTVGGTAIGGAFSALGQGLKWTGKKITPKIIQASGASESKIIRKFGKTVSDLVTKYGKNADELLGPIEEKNMGGTFKAGLKEAEDIIQETVNTAGTNLKIDGKIITNALKKELSLQKVGLDDEVVAGLTKIIKAAEKKYKNGITAKQALQILRQANSKYGKAMATTPTGSTAKIAQMTIAETMRDTLKQMFPELKDALQTQSEILTLRPIVESYRGTTVSKAGQGLIKRGFELDKPSSYPIIGDVITAVGNKVAPTAMKVGGDVLQSPLARQAVIGGLNVPQGEEMGVEPEISPMTAPTTQDTLDTGNLPSPEQQPILSEGGQWRWDENSQDWVPNTEGGQVSLTGYSPEELYNAATKAYQAGDKASYTQLMGMYDDETKYQKEQSKKGKGATLTAGQKKEISDFEVSIRQMSSLDTSIDEFKEIMGPIQGRARAMNPYDVDAQSFNSKMKAIAQVVGKAMEGGVLRKEDELKYARMLPQITDTPQVARNKIKNVKEMLELQKKTKEDLYLESENMGDIYSPVITEEE